MIAVDVNVVVSALHGGARDHEEMRTWLENAVNANERVGISEAVLTGTLRILTHPKVFIPPATTDQAVALLADLVSHPNVSILSGGPLFWDRLAALSVAAQARGNLVADAAHAATAMENNATFVTKDRDFARFSGLKWRVPSQTG